MMTDHQQPFRQQEDVLSGRHVALGASVVFVLSVTMVAVAVFICAHEDAQLRPSGVFPESALARRHAVARVQQDLFSSSGIGQQLQQSERQQLEQFQWVDGGGEQVAIPVDDAMNLYLSLSRGRP